MPGVTPAIAGCLVVDISRHVDKYGLPTGDAAMLAYRVLAGAPPGISIRLNIGAMRDPIGDLMPFLIQGGILNARDVAVEGTETEGIEAVMRALRGVRDRRTAA